MSSNPSPYEKLQISPMELFPKDQNYTFLVGAGISMDYPADMPTAIQMVKDLFSLFVPDEEIPYVLKLETIRFELVVELIQNVIDRDLKFLDYMEEVNTPNLIHNFLARFILKGNNVITTNFDYLLENSLKNLLPENKLGKIRVMITKQDFLETITKPEILRHFYNLVKIHGSKRNIITNEFTQESLVATISALGRDRSEGEIFAIEPYKKEVLYSMIKNHTLVIMGYSGNDDFDITPLLREIPYISRLIWIDHTNSENVEYLHFSAIASESNTESNKLIRFLYELKNIQDYDVVLIKTNTKTFIQNHLWQIFHPEAPPSDIVHADMLDIQDFRDFISNIYGSLGSLQKYHFITELYYKIKDIPSAERCAKRGLVIATKSNAMSVKSTFFNYLGLIHQIYGNYEKGLDFFTRALLIEQELGDSAAEASILNNIGGIQSQLGNYEDALKNYNLTLRIADELGNKEEKITSLNNIGQIYENMTQFKKALKFYKTALEISETIGELDRRAVLHNNIGKILSQEDPNEAILHYKKALKLTELIGDLQGQNILYNNIGRILAENGDLNTAISMLTKSITIAEKLGDKSKKAGVLSNLGSLSLAKNDLNQALDYFQQASKLENKHGNPQLSGIYFNNIGMIYQQRNQIDQAIESYRIALQKFESISGKSYIGLMHSKLGDCFFLKKNYDEALKHYLTAKKIYSSSELDDPKNLASVTSNLARNYEYLGKHEDALRFYEEALEMDETLGDTANIAMDYFNIGKMQKIQDHLPVAIDNLRKSLDLFEQLGMTEKVESIKRLLNTL